MQAVAPYVHRTRFLRTLYTLSLVTLSALGIPGLSFAQDAGTSTSTTDSGIRVQTPPPPLRPSSIREEVLGYDPAQRTLVYVERTSSPLAGFDHVHLVRVTPDGAYRRIALTTETDVAQIRGASDRESARAPVEARVQRDISSARQGLQNGTVIPASERGGPSVCQNPPFAPREFTIGEGMVGRVTVSADNMFSTVEILQNNRPGQSSNVPSVFISASTGQSARVPYTRIADVRELPGTDRLAVLLRSDACTPERAPVPVTAILAYAPPPPERPLQALTHAEFIEWDIIRRVAPRARRRVVDDEPGFYEGRARVRFDNAWSFTGPDGSEQVLVQYSRHDADVPLSVVSQGSGLARFAIMRRRGNNLSILGQLVPPPHEQVFEGVSQEAYGADLDNDGMPEFIIRARLQSGDEVLTVLQNNDGFPHFVIRRATVLDGRHTPRAATVDVRRCTAGTDVGQLVLRCTIDTFHAGSAPDAQPISTVRVIERIRYNGGTVQLTEERR